jgi:3-phenylpropionate/trans-cinnamate dioxygenase ferredoxin reductase component
MRCVIVGAGLAGVSAAAELREAGGPGHEIVLIGEERETPYDHPPLSKGYLRGEATEDDAALKEPGWYADAGIERRAGDRATRITADGDAVELDTGQVVPFDRCLIATGGRARRLDVPGADLPGVLTLRTLADARVLREAAASRPRVVVVGGGFIGAEVAASLRARGCRVDLLMLERVVLEGPLGPGLGAVVSERLAAAGVGLHPGATVTAIEGDDRVRRVASGSGMVLDADLVVAGVGMEPATEMAEASGLALDGGGIACDESLRTSRAHVFAAGDIASVMSTVAGGRIRVEHWAEALNQGKLAARAMLGEPAVYDRVPYFFSDIGESSIEYVGLGGPMEREVLIDRDGGRVSCHVRDGRVVGVATLDDAGDALDTGREVVREGLGADEARELLAA